MAEVDIIVSRGTTQVRVVRNLDDLQRVFAVRTLAFCGEQDCPYEEEFDGNDLAGVHLLAEQNGAPVGTMRLRFFAGFAKSERYAVIKSCRGRDAAMALIDAACIICARKGYNKILGHAQKRVAPFWIRRGGGYLREGRPGFSFSGHEYVEIIRELDTPNNALNLESPALLLARPEGDWDREGVLDRSEKAAA